MAEPADSAAVTAAALLNDNRTAVCGKTATGYRVVVLPTLPNGLAFTAKKTGGAATGTVVNADTTKAAHIGSADVESVTVPIDWATLASDGTNRYLRTQFFKSQVGDPSSGKWCYTNIKGAPLAANGTPTTVALAVDARDATPANRKLTALGEAVTNYTQPGPAPGTYTVTELQQSTGKPLGWTAQRG